MFKPKISDLMYRLHTMARAYTRICEGERPWTALGDFTHDWFGCAKSQRADLVAEALLELEGRTPYECQWAVFIAASVEWLCQKYEVLCPEWVHNPVYVLSEPWFIGMAADKPYIRERLMIETPEPFIRRNIYCGDRMYNNKYEADDLVKQLLEIQKAVYSYEHSEVAPPSFSLRDSSFLL